MMNPINATVATNGTLAARAANRKGGADMLLTVYGNIGAEPMPPGAPAQGGCPVDTKTHGASTKPAAPAATGDVTITSIAVQTVVPVISNTTTSANVGTAAPYAVPPKPSPSNVTPYTAAAPPSDKAVSALWTLGWGLALWFGVFGVMSVV